MPAAGVGRHRRRGERCGCGHRSDHQVLRAAEDRVEARAPRRRVEADDTGDTGDRRVGQRLRHEHGPDGQPGDGVSTGPVGPVALQRGENWEAPGFRRCGSRGTKGITPGRVKHLHPSERDRSTTLSEHLDPARRALARDSASNDRDGSERVDGCPLARRPPTVCAGSRTQRSRWGPRTSTPRSGRFTASRWTGSGWTSTRSRRPTSAASCARPGTSRSPSGRSTRTTTRTRIPSCSSRARSSSGRPAGPVSLDDYRNWWEYVPGRVLEAPGGPRHDDQRPRPPPGRPGRLRGRRGLRGLGRQGAADRGRVGVRRARRARGRRLRLGRRALPGRQADGEHVAGRVPVAEPEARRLRGHLAGRQLPAERLRPLRHDRERLGVDVRTGTRRVTPTRSRAPAACRATRASRRPTRSHLLGQPESSSRAG